MKDQDDSLPVAEKKLVASSTTQSAVISTEISDQNSSNADTKVAGSSSQKQLLSLAKHFVLDGALLPENKQMPLEERVVKRERFARLRQQQNLEAIIQKSLHYCPRGANSAKADQDWFNRFTHLAEDVSNKTMQDLWAKILAGEITQPGSFSLKSLNVFKLMSITDAKLLAKVCGLVVKDNSRKNLRLLSGSYKTPSLWSFMSKTTQSSINLNQCGISYSEILSLADNKLIFSEETESRALQKGEQMVFNFNGRTLTLTANVNQCGLRFYKFTPIGSELALLISDKPNKELVPLLSSSLHAHFSVNADE